jgi:hypothetical protein
VTIGAVLHRIEFKSLTIEISQRIATIPARKGANEDVTKDATGNVARSPLEWPPRIVLWLSLPIKYETKGR